MSIYQDTHSIYHVYLDISNFLRLILMLLYMNGISPLNFQVINTVLLYIANSGDLYHSYTIASKSAFENSIYHGTRGIYHVYLDI
jgi:hypothetical protein